MMGMIMGGNGFSNSKYWIVGSDEKNPLQRCKTLRFSTSNTSYGKLYPKEHVILYTNSGQRAISFGMFIGLYHTVDLTKYNSMVIEMSRFYCYQASNKINIGFNDYSSATRTQFVIGDSGNIISEHSIQSISTTGTSNYDLYYTLLSGTRVYSCDAGYHPKYIVDISALSGDYYISINGGLMSETGSTYGAIYNWYLSTESAPATGLTQVNIEDDYT